MSNNQQLIHSLQQQTKRLLDQLKQLEENKDELAEEQYSELKKETLEQLKTFQNSLNSMLKDPNNSLLESEIEKTKRSIFEAFKSQFNKDQVVDKLLSEQVKGTRNRIKDLDNQYHLKQIQETEYVGKKRKMIVQIEETGAKLSPEERDWLNLHHFTESSTQAVKEQTQKNQMKIVQKKIEQN